MGTTTSKKNDNTGEIVNNLTIDEVIQVENKTIIWILLVILLILIINLILKIYTTHRRGLRKRYLNSPARLAVIGETKI